MILSRYTTWFYYVILFPDLIAKKIAVYWLKWNTLYTRTSRSIGNK